MKDVNGIQTAMDPQDPSLAQFLTRHGLARPGEEALWSPLTGGVSSDIWRVDLPGRTLCVKRALPKLKVAADWHAPVSRNAYEWAWLQFAAQHCPENVPQPLAHDADAGLFAMAFLDPQDHPVWKTQLLEGTVQPSTAAAVGQVLGHLHQESAGRSDLAAAFDSESNFCALRLEPYLVATAKRHPEAAETLLGLAQRTARARVALVHGDVSPKNILVGPIGPVILDAECAWYGDPAFDVAFCLNHLLLKCLVQPGQAQALRASFDAFQDAYLSRVGWEEAAELERRAAALLPGLLLARSDGKSPVEYLVLEEDRVRIRAVSIAHLLEPSTRLAAVADDWFATFACGH